VLPSSGAPDDLFYLTVAPAGLYLCVETDNWQLYDNVVSVAAMPPSEAAWGAISGTLSAQTDLGTALSGKAASTHAHGPSDVTGTAVVTNDARLSDARTPLTHTHSYEPSNANIQTHVTAAHAPAGAQANAAITKAEIEAKLTGELSSHSHAGGGGPAFPVGSVFIAVVATDPATLLGYGTWAALAAGRVLVGLDSGDPNFDTVEETGGAKTVAASAQTFAGTESTAIVNHLHTLATGSGATGNFSQVIGTVDTSSGGTGATPTQTALGTRSGNPVAGGVASYTPAGTNTPGAATSVVQPYITVYMWKRTA